MQSFSISPSPTWIATPSTPPSRNATIPRLRDKPVIIGGGRRGVVSTACYIARIKGVRSAMPMFQALKLCPEAVVVRGRMDVYVEVSRQIRAMMEELTPTIEPLSLDEAFLDLTGTTRLHGEPPAILLARLVNRMKSELGITGSIGLSHNKFLAKMASDMDKPQGFSVIGRAETLDILAPKPVGVIWGLGAAGQQSPGRGRHPHHRRPAPLGPRRPDPPLRQPGDAPLPPRPRRGRAPRRPRPRKTKSISNETTFSTTTSPRSTSSTAISGAWPKSSPTAPRPKAWRAAPSH
jgi:DNA polymerase-4